MSFARLISLALLATLAACNMAVSETPMFAESERSDVRLKDGYWLLDDSECQIDFEKAVKRWPKCADWVLFDRNRIMESRDGKFDEISESERDLFIAAGTPLILQMFVKPDNGERPFYTFIALATIATDTEKQVKAADFWLIQCGATQPNTMAVKPFPGFNTDCQPSSIDVMRAAAVASRPEINKINRAKWVRTAQP